MNGNFATVDDTRAVLHALKAEGIDTVDTAQAYGESESLLGSAGARLRSIRNTVVATYPVHVFYLHCPNRNTDLEDTLSSVNELYNRGKFVKFGLSSFLPHEVEEVIRVARENDCILPTVYQGSYSAVARKPETELLPLLRQYVYDIEAIWGIVEGAAILDPVNDVMFKAAL
ncbi:hypothetical protein AnigIFM62618_006933 [Aspergillus niger]|nr:hypothetical protein AnigIFM62618_006933 [Aspergillus niger]